MPTSNKTRQYWVNVAKGWAENALTHPDYNGSPQLDEFNAVMDELLELSDSLTQIVSATQPTSHEMIVNVRIANDDAASKFIEEQINKIVPPEMRETIRAIPVPILQAVRDILESIPGAFPNEALDIVVAAMKDGRNAYHWYEIANKRKIQPAILKLAVRLLEDAAESYGSHSCNDFEMEDTPKNLNIVSEVAKQNGWDINPENFRTKRANGETVIIAMDYELMAYCARILKEAANG